MIFFIGTGIGTGQLKITIDDNAQQETDLYNSSIQPSFNLAMSSPAGRLDPRTTQGTYVGRVFGSYPGSPC